MKVKPVGVVTTKTAKEKMLESLKARDDDEDDMDIDPPPIIVTPAEQYRMTPAALKYHQSINSKPKISVIRPAKKQQSLFRPNKKKSGTPFRRASNCVHSQPTHCSVI